MHHRRVCSAQEFELIEKRSQLIQSLSDGEYVRMQLVRLILQDPDVVLLDEPAAMLDSTWRKKVYEYLSDFNKNSEFCAVITGGKAIEFYIKK